MHKTIRKWSRLSAILLTAALVSTGCSDSSTRDTTASGGDSGDSASGDLSKTEIYTQQLIEKPAEGEPQMGGTLTVAEYAEARTLDPTLGYANGAVGGSAMAAVFDTLMRYDVETGAWEPKLAESLESADQQTWTLKLRDGVTFSDGSPVDADAVMASIGRYLKAFAYQSPTMLANQVAMKKVDANTVEFTMARPWATFPAMLAGGAGMIVAPAAYKDPAAFKPIGAGPFELENYAPQEELVLKKRADYWDGEPYLDQLRFVWLGADDAKMESMASGEVDSAYIRSPLAVEKARKDGYQGMLFVVGVGSQIAINTREGRPGADPRVREALMLAFDNESYLARAQQGAGIASKAIFAETSPWATGVEYPAPDPAAATKLLDEAKADGYDGKLSYLVGSDPLSQTAAVQVQAQLEAVGFKVSIESSDNIADGTKRLYVDHDFDIALSSTSVNDEDPYAALNETLSSTGSTNLSGIADKELDASLAELQANAADPAAGMAAMTKVEERYRDLIPGIIINPSGNFVVWQDNVHGISPTVLTMVLYDKAWKAQ